MQLIETSVQTQLSALLTNDSSLHACRRVPCFLDAGNEGAPTTGRRAAVPKQVSRTQQRKGKTNPNLKLSPASLGGDGRPATLTKPQGAMSWAAKVLVQM